MTYFGGRIKKEGVTIGTKAKVIINSTYDTYKFVFLNAEGVYETWFFKPNISNRQNDRYSYIGNIGYYQTECRIISLSIEPENYEYLWIETGSRDYNTYNKIEIDNLRRLNKKKIK